MELCKDCTKRNDCVLRPYYWLTVTGCGEYENESGGNEMSLGFWVTSRTKDKVEKQVRQAIAWYEANESRGTKPRYIRLGKRLYKTLVGGLLAAEVPLVLDTRLNEMQGLIPLPDEVEEEWVEEQ